MKLNKTMIRGWCGTTDYNQGRSYFMDKRVHRFTAKAGTESVSAHCLVKGTRTYDVSVRIDGSDWMAQCTCPRYADTGCCKHIAAALLRLEEQMQKDAQAKATDRNALRVLEQYRRKVERSSLVSPERPVWSPP